MSYKIKKNLELKAKPARRPSDQVIRAESHSGGSSKLAARKGIATLPTVVVLGILILAIGIAMTALTFTESFISVGQNQSSKALYYAEAGARDALMRISRDKNFTTSTPYQISFVASGCVDKSGCADVTVSAGTGAVGDPKIINSKGQSGINLRQIEVSVFFDVALNGQIATTTWREAVN